MILSTDLFASRFDELDKPPEGAYKGQMLLSGFVLIGVPVGKIIDAENDFLNSSTYELIQDEVWKKLMVTHMTFGFGLSFEYMFFDHAGLKTRIKRTVIIQRTIFGSQYENWSKKIYSDFSFYLGPAFHLTSRKQWDVTLTPLAGVAVGKFQATPVARELVDSYAGEGDRTVTGFTCGTELNFTVYFSGGLFISLGFDWTMNLLQFDSEFNLTNPDQPASPYFPGKQTADVHSLTFIISAGYAFLN